MRVSRPGERRRRSIAAPTRRSRRPNRRRRPRGIDHRQRCERAVVPVIPVSLAAQLSLALVVLGLLVFAMASLRELWNRQP